MLANAELAQDFALLNQQFKELVEGLVDVVNIPPVRVEVGTCLLYTSPSPRDHG